ncbi:uncharacterized protein LOC141633929 [Silene latifolia]|uniref:uncharacterized protein LOC141633929 n=1 Tax=Silene latifolia TaxID=37657 RepID=UPI003D76C047
MSIDCSSVEQFPPLISVPKNSTQTKATDLCIFDYDPFLWWRGLEVRCGKTKSVNEVVGIAPYDLDSLVPEEQEWVVQRRRKGKSPLAVIAEEPADLLQFTQEDVKEELEFWKNSVYCFVLGANPPVEVVDGFIRRIWAHLPIDKVSFLPNGVFLVRFTSNQAKDRVLQQGHFLFDNKPLIVRPWSADVELVKSDVKDVPVWVRFMNLPLKFWGKSLPKLAGLLGKFVQCDAATKDKTRLGFARVMVEVPFGKAIHASVKFLDEDGIVVTIKVECEWKPVLCKKCQGVGHEATNCRKASPPQSQKVTVPKEGQKQWRPKTLPKKTGIPVVAKPVVSIQEEPKDMEVVHTPVELPNQFQVSWARNGKYHMVNTPAKKIIRLSRQELLDHGRSSGKLGTSNLLESLNNMTPKAGIGVTGSVLPPFGGNA